ncbi:MAG: transglycosylase SLT domain-containing protein [Acidimicrobiia bacterium]
MGFPMRYPRFLIVCFVALGLAASSTGVARADHTDARSAEPAYAGSVFDLDHQGALGGDPGPLFGAVELLADRTHLDSDEAGELLDAVAALILAVADAGQRTGVLAIPEVNQLITEVLQSPQSIEVSPEVVDPSEPPSGAGGVIPTVDAVAAGESPEEAAADPVERWRPLVERYFAEERVSEALSIIACESNGDPSITNPRSSAAGLFQFISGTWEHSSEQAGFGGTSAFDPEANVAAAAWLVGHSLDAGRSAWAHWTCQP